MLVAPLAYHIDAIMTYIPAIHFMIMVSEPIDIGISMKLIPHTGGSDVVIRIVVITILTPVFAVMPCQESAIPGQSPSGL
jgi:hypothetical protein